MKNARKLQIDVYRPPLISVALATYNGGQYLKEQLDSIYNQSYDNIEVIVTDDCSTDKTVEILAQYSQSHGLKYFVNDINMGFLKNFEKAISRCKGEYVALSDQDDIWEKRKLETLVNEVGVNLLIHSDCSIIDEQGKVIIKNWKTQNGFNIKVENLLFGNVVTGCTILFSKDLLNRALPFPDGIYYHDWWLAFCAADEEKITYTPKCLTRYRQHGDQNTGINKIINPLERLYLNVQSRWKGNDTERIIDVRRQQRNLLAIKEKFQCLTNNKKTLDDAILYFDDYLKNIIHVKTFYIGLKYHKQVYPKKNYMFIKNILRDLIG